MENTQLAWSDLGDGYGLDKRLSGGKLGLVLLISSASDAKHCCAMNYERTVFRSPKVVKYAEKSFVPIRLDRSHGLGKSLYAKYDLLDKNPAVLVVDSDGDLLYKTQLCTEPKDCLKGLQTAMLMTSRRQAYAPKVNKRLAVAREGINGKEYRDALISLGKINKKYLTAPLRKKVARYYKKLESDARKRLKVASRYEKKNDFGRASEIYREVSRSFSRMKKVKTRAVAGLKRVSSRIELEKRKA